MPPSITSDMSSSSPSSDDVLDQALVLLGVVLGLDDRLVLLDRHLLLDLLGLGLGLELGLGGDDAGRRPRPRPRDDGRARRARLRISRSNTAPQAGQMIGERPKS